MESYKQFFGKKILITIAISTALGLSSCGGGGGSTPAGSGSSFSATTSGRAAKGIIQHGIVTADELDGSGSVVAKVGTATTDSTGDYNLKIGSNYKGGVIRLTISSNGSTTKMICDVRPNCGKNSTGTAITFGKTINLPASFTMQALLPPVTNGAQVKAQITPYTNMAVARVAAGGKFDKTAVDNAISEVSKIVGVPVMQTRPADITDASSLKDATDTAKAYAAFNAGAGKILFANPYGIEQGLKDLSASFKDGKFDNADKIKIADLTNDVQTQASDSGIHSTSLTQILQGIKNDTVNGTFDPQPTPTADQNNIDQAKAMMSEIRTLGDSITALQTPAQAFGDKLTLAKNVLNNNSQVLTQTLGLVLDAVTTALDTNYTLALGGTRTIQVKDSTGVSLGSVSVALTDNNGLTASITGTNLSGVNVNLTLTSSAPVSAIPTAAKPNPQFSFTHAKLGLSGSIKNAQVSITLTGINLTTSLDSQATVTVNQGISHPVKLTSMELKGGVSIDAKQTNFTGNADFTLVKLAAANQAQPQYSGDAKSPLSLKKASLNGTFSNNNNSFKASVTLSVNNAATFDTLAFLNYESDIWISNGWNGTSGDIFGLKNYVTTYLTTTGGGTLSPNSSIDYSSPSWGKTTNFTDTSGWQSIPGGPANLVAQLKSEYKQLNPGASNIDNGNVDNIYISYDGSSNTTSFSAHVHLPDFETAKNFAQATLTLSLDLALQNQPKTTAIVTVTRNGLKSADATVTISNDKGNNVTFTSKNISGILSALEITNTDGVKVTVNNIKDQNNVTGDVRVNGTKVGHIDDRGTTPLIRYTDGTFDSLN